MSTPYCSSVQSKEALHSLFAQFSVHQTPLLLAFFQLRAMACVFVCELLVCNCAGFTRDSSTCTLQLML